ncbi:PqqD family protein [Demequina sp.]|uniref:PqqD family protein n=1 Tax=Demequina sp. TaxID=2050685 RepID=UPI003D144729
MTSRLVRASGLAEVGEQGACYVLNLPRIEEQQSPYVFEGPAFEIWSRIDGTRTEEQIVDELVEATGAERQVVARDTSDFLATLRGLGLIEDVE